MSSVIEAIHLGGVNCYLFAAGDGCILVDTGFMAKRPKLEKSLESLGCTPGKLKLIVLTHGDSDHTGNADFLRNKYGCKIVMHGSDLGMVERGDMGWNRKAKPDKYSVVFRLIGFLAKAAAKKAEFEKFKPDLIVDEGFDLSPYGLEAKIVHIPGHSKGSIGVLTEDGKLCCGDFAYNVPGFQFVDDRDEQRKSLDKVKRLKIETLYPGHGKPFPMKVLLKRS